MEERRGYTRRILRRGRAALEWELQLSPMVERIDLYADCADWLEEWATTVLLPQMDAAIESAPRKRRLYADLSVLRLRCDGQLWEDRWLSVRWTLSSTVADDCSDYRVWDLQTGNLCPIEYFLPRKVAGRYLRWSFQIDGQRVWGIPKGNWWKKGGTTPVEAGNLKYPRLPS